MVEGGRGEATLCELPVCMSLSLPLMLVHFGLPADATKQCPVQAIWNKHKPIDTAMKATSCCACKEFCISSALDLTQLVRVDCSRKAKKSLHIPSFPSAGNIDTLCQYQELCTLHNLKCFLDLGPAWLCS